MFADVKNLIISKILFEKVSLKIFNYPKTIFYIYLYFKQYFIKPYFFL